MKKRDEIFLLSLNSVYKKFKHYKNNGDISVYSYGDFEVDNIPSSGDGDKAFFIAKNGGLIFVDYSLITNEVINNKMMEDEIEKYKDFDTRQGRIAGILCFSVLAYRECLKDFNEEEIYFSVDIHDYFIRD